MTPTDPVLAALVRPLADMIAREVRRQSRAMARKLVRRPRWVTPQGLAAYLQVPVKTVHTWASEGILPRHAIDGTRGPWYDLNEIDALLGAETGEETLKRRIAG